MMKPQQLQGRAAPGAARYARARAAFRVAYMSNAKWYKVLKTIALADLRLAGAEWKFTDSDRLYHWGVPRVQDLLPDRLADGRFQPVEYKWIEWIRFPRSYRPDPSREVEVEQDLEGLRQVLATVGRLQIEHEPGHLTLLGYGR